MKKITLLIVCFLSLFLANAQAYDFSQETKEGEQRVTLYYAINPDGKSVTIVKGPQRYAFSSAIIPEKVTHEGVEYTVTTIGSSAFESSDIDIIVMPNTITEIMSYAFKSSTVDSIQFSKGLKHIREHAFSHVSDMLRVELPEGLETIGDNAFFEDDSYRPNGIQYVYIPNSVYEIGKSAFAYQRCLLSVRLPEGLKELKDGTFYFCSNLQKITLPKELETIGAAVFQSSGLNEIKITDKVKTIGEVAFQYTSLKNVVIPDNVVSLGKSVFSGCIYLQSIQFSKGMKVVPEYACSGCKELVEVVIPEGIEKVGYLAFSGCTLLSGVKFPESVKEMGFGIFMDSGITRFTFPKQITAVPQSTFSGCVNIAEFVVLEHITSIGVSAFEYCSNLMKVVLPANLKDIGKSAFSDCKVLSEVNLPDNVVSIGDGAFQYCEKLKEILLPKRLKELGSYAYGSCTELENVVFSDSLETIGQSAFGYCKALKVAELPKRLNFIHDNVFQDCSALERAVIPHSVERMGRNTFINCTNLSELHINRAILPSMSSKVVSDDNNCTLYVPRGAKATYEASSDWNNFKAIVEEDVPDVYYTVEGVVKSGYGTVTIDGASIQNAKEILAQQSATVCFAANEGYVIEKILCNGKEIDAEVYNARQFEYTIESVEANYLFEAYYKHAPVMLYIKSGNGGSIGVSLEKGTRFACRISAEEGWQIHSVTFNGSDVTADVTEEGEYVTPAINTPAELNVAFELLNSIETESVADVRVYPAAGNSIVVEGVNNNEAIRVYSSNGILVKEIVNADNREVVTLPEDIYVVETCGRVFKIAN